MKLTRHKFKYLAYVYSTETWTLVPIECHFEYVQPLDVEQLEFVHERVKANLAKAEEQLAELEQENTRLRAALDAAFDFANAHSLPYLEDAMKIALVATTSSEDT
jgi:hypothetical protein